MEPKLKAWTANIDPTTIPREVILSQMARLRSFSRKTHSGGAIWGHHNPETSRCKCVNCNQKRAAK